MNVKETMSGILNSKITVKAPAGKKPVMQLVAPATGVLVNFKEIAHPLCHSGLLGDGVAISMTRGEIVAPVDCRVEKVDVAKAQLKLVSEKGLKILLQLGEPGVIQLGERLQINIRSGERCAAGTMIAQCDPLWIKLSGHAPLCIITLLNTTKLSALQVMPGSSVRAGDEGFIKLFV